MRSIKFEALVVSEVNGVFSSSVTDVERAIGADGFSLIKVEYSGLNYKDALSYSGNRGVTKQYPHTPGIDAAGVVIESSGPDALPIGQTVSVNGFDLGMNTPGGFAQYIYVPNHWAVPIKKFDTYSAALLGTPALTAAGGVLKMLQNLDDLINTELPILVTGAQGAVGMYAVNLLKSAKIGKIIAATRNPEQAKFLFDLGADDIINTNTVLVPKNKLLTKPQWGNVFDTLGGDYLASAIKACAFGGNVVSVGNVTGNNLDISVLPFIINQVNVLGISSANASPHQRSQRWNFIENNCSNPKTIIPHICISLSEAPKYLEAMLDGTHSKRTILKIN